MWIETRFSGEPIDAVKMVMASHSTGQLVLHISQGTICAVVWRERVTTPIPNSLDKQVARG